MDGFSEKIFPVFSTYVEVILRRITRVNRSKGFLHVCGGDPTCVPVNSSKNEFSPRMWR